MIFIKQGEFYINGISGFNQLSSVITSLPDIPKPQRRRTSTPLLGASRYAFTKEDVYNNREFSLSIAVEAHNERERSQRGDQLFKAFNPEMYCPFIYYYEPDYTYFVLSSDATTTARIARADYATIYDFKLSADAFKYYKYNQSFNLEKGGTLNNAFIYTSKPYIKIIGNGKINLSINDTVYAFQNVSECIEIDSGEGLQEVFKTEADGSISYQNEKFLSGQDFPKLEPGLNKISVDNEAKVTIEPRWRTI